MGHMSSNTLPPPSEPVVRVEGLTKSYGGRTVVDEFDLEVAAGEVVGLIGANGAGKTTTVECVQGLRRPDAASGNLRSGESITDAVAVLVDKLDGVVPAALLVNCSLPESISAAVPSLVEAGSALGLPVGAYANGFGAVDPDDDTDSTVELLGRRDDLDPAGYLAWTRGWIAAGLTLVGGCCEIGPAQIAAIGNEAEATVVLHACLVSDSVRCSQCLNASVLGQRIESDTTSITASSAVTAGRRSVSSQVTAMKAVDPHSAPSRPPHRYNIPDSRVPTRRPVAFAE